MTVEIVKGELKHLDDCVEALLQSELGKQYFTAHGAKKEITMGISNGEIYVAINELGHCLGFAWGIFHGAFYVYPYVHIVAVKEELRGRGIGKQLINYCEEVVFANYSKIFLVVAEFSFKTKKLYEHLGYVQVGEIPSLYKEGITEYLMMKNITRIV